MHKLIFPLLTFFFTGFCYGQISRVWVSDNGNGTYTNPVIHADYSDPDVVRVNDDYYMVSSSFNNVPGLPILHSKDLVNWTHIGHALKELPPKEYFRIVQHGAGVWAPSIRFHKNEFYIYYPDPDFGIYLIKARSITGPWSEPLLVEAGKGLIDPCPLWDNGKVYLVHAFAGSRAGFKSIIVVKELNAGGTKPINSGVMVYDGHSTDPTVEGPKFYKRNNYYYIFAPAGGVSTGWQLVLRSKNIYGPYERKVVMSQGDSHINGPHQGAWVTTPSGEDWFIHFQDKEAYGRVVHLQPMKWISDWPVIGADKMDNGNGQPLITYKKPLAINHPVKTLPDTDEFNLPVLGLQWQWPANPRAGAAFPTAAGFLRLNSLKISDSLANLWNVPGMLLQKFPANIFTATSRVIFHPAFVNDRVGMIVFGSDYASVSLVKKADGNYITFNTALDADKNAKEREVVLKKSTGTDVYFRITVRDSAMCRFSFSEDGITFISAPGEFKAKPGRWVGSRIGFFCTGTTKTNDAGFADLDWIRFTK